MRLVVRDAGEERCDSEPDVNDPVDDFVDRVDHWVVRDVFGMTHYGWRWVCVGGVQGCCQPEDWRIGLGQNLAAQRSFWGLGFPAAE